jgi:protein disulfide-isomerase
MRAALLFHALLILALTTAASGQAPESIAWLGDLESAKQIARQTKRPILVHFWAHGCPPCQNLDQNVYAVPEVKQAMESSFVLVRLNAADYPATASLYGVKGWPTDVILAPDGQLVTRLSCPPTALMCLGQLDTILHGPGSQRTLANVNIPPGATPANTPFTDEPETSSASKWAMQNGAAVAPQDVTGLPGYAGQPIATAAQPQQSAPPANRIVSYDWSDQHNMQSAATVNKYLAPYGQQQSAGGGIANPVAPAAGAATGIVGYGASNLVQPAPSVGAAYATRPLSGSMQEITPALTASQQPVAPQYTMVPATQAPPLGLDGYCPVELHRLRTRYTKGDPRFGAVHRGRTYLFSSADAQQEFLRDPDRYSPVMAGNDPVLLFDQGQFVPGTRRLGLFVGDRVYLFANEQTRAKFQSDMHRYTDAVQVAQSQHAGAVR